MFTRGETAEYDKLLEFTQKVIQVTQKSNGLVSSRGLYAYHILFDESQMSSYFDGIREGLLNRTAGMRLMELLDSGDIRADSSNCRIWSALMRSMEFSGIDFEHAYKILPSKGSKGEDKSIWAYTFEESIVLSHTLLVVPVMQHYGPLMPKLDLNSNTTKKFEQALPLLAVGMIGDCVKGEFFEQIKALAAKGDQVAQSRLDRLLDPKRLQQKMHGLVRALLRAREELGTFGLRVDATLVGTGAFGGSAKNLAQPFVDSLNSSDMPFDQSKDEVNYFMFPPPKQEELTLAPMKYKVNLNVKKGLGSAPEAGDNIVRVVVAGFDPVSLAPHGVMNRVFSAEGQLSHATDILYRLTREPGRFVPVRVPKGPAWESAAAFFAKPQETKYKEEEGYDSVRFVPMTALKQWGIKEGQEASVQLVATERVPPRVWNGDSFDGWTLKYNAVPGKTWQEIIKSDSLKINTLSVNDLPVRAASDFQGRKMGSVPVAAAAKSCACTCM